MFDPPPALHERFEAALARVRGRLGGEYPMWIGGKILSDTVQNVEEDRLEDDGSIRAAHVFH